MSFVALSCGHKYLHKNLLHPVEGSKVQESGCGCETGVKVIETGWGGGAGGAVGGAAGGILDLELGGMPLV